MAKSRLTHRKEMRHTIKQPQQPLKRVALGPGNGRRALVLIRTDSRILISSLRKLDYRGGATHRVSRARGLVYQPRLYASHYSPGIWDIFGAQPPSLLPCNICTVGTVMT